MLTNQGHRSRERFLRVRADLNRAVAALRCSRSVDAGRDLPVAKIGVLTEGKAHGERPNGRSARFVVVTSDGAHTCNLPSLQLQSRHCGSGFDSMRRRLQERWGSPATHFSVRLKRSSFCRKTPAATPLSAASARCRSKPASSCSVAESRLD